MAKTEITAAEAAIERQLRQLDAAGQHEVGHQLSIWELTHDTSTNGGMYEMVRFAARAVNRYRSRHTPAAVRGATAAVREATAAVREDTAAVQPSSAAVRGGSAAPFLVRDNETGMIEARCSGYDGTIPLKAVANFNHLMMKKITDNEFAPFDGLDAYWLGIEEMESVSARINRGEIELSSASPATYTANAGCRAVRRFLTRTVMKENREHSGKKAGQDGHGAVGEDGFDVDNFDFTRLPPSSAMCSASENAAGPVDTADESYSHPAYGLRMPFADDGEMNRDKARRALDLIFAHLDHLVVIAFETYLLADGNLYAAAKIAGIPKSTYYRYFPIWLARARKIWEKIEGAWH